MPLVTKERLIALTTSALSDAMGKTNAMTHEMQCRSANPCMAGPAFTVRVHPADILMVGIAASQCPPGHVLVIDGRGELNTALWGGLTTMAARLKGIEGVVVDGAIRDMAEIRRDVLPVFARAVVPNAGGAEYPGEVNVPVQCAGVIVEPGDWMVGDDDGVIVIPAARLDETMQAATRIREAEQRMDAAIKAGQDVAQLLGYFELLERKRSQIFVPQLRVQS